MFGYKSSEIVTELVDALPFVRTRSGRPQLSTDANTLEVPRVPGKHETYIAHTQFTLASMPFFRWGQ